MVQDAEGLVLGSGFGFMAVDHLCKTTHVKAVDACTVCSSVSRRLRHFPAAVTLAPAV
jgi:hypothetical protein